MRRATTARCGKERLPILPMMRSGNWGWGVVMQMPAVCQRTVNAWGESGDCKVGMKERCRNKGTNECGEGSQEAEDHGMGGN